MKVPREGAARTRQHLLIAAGEIFGEKGYRETTIAEICERAGTNIAAVNYHFGSKQALYIESWRHAFSESIKAFPPSGGVSDDAPPEERLRGQVTAILRRIADENNREFLFMQREMANPTGLLEEVLREEIGPLQQRTAGLVRELLGPMVPEQKAKFCELSIISQCMNPIVARRGLGQRNAGEDGPPEIDDMEAYADHVVKFSLAGIQSLRKVFEEQGQGSKKGKPSPSLKNGGRRS
ncbi:DNA-binding transcriptional regulator, AcrR family [Syntrophus gentianae]|uniref:DNA-binding transcriptional regulator, AcrR family n=1 Tax=Syntrophus gentianae TaxID=43775 RepID=A0A1H7V4B1_9BACT|nr:CerR family C-terminal domain-containing protein [Syntrophus gentianae]SEM03964.1 DNA-binding transcriptional regulator, AcrR family [Syntrophus gentianae]